MRSTVDKLRILQKESEKGIAFTQFGRGLVYGALIGGVFSMIFGFLLGMAYTYRG